SLDLLRHHDDTVEIPKNQIPRRNLGLTDLDGATVIHHLRAHRGILRKTAAAEHRPVLFQHFGRVAMETIDDRADGAALFGGGGEDFTPIGTAHFAAAREIDFAGLQLVERFGEFAEGLLLLAEDINYQHRHRAARDLHFLAQRLDGLRQKLVGITKVVEDVAHDG